MIDCFGKFLDDRTCAYCHAATQELHIECKKLKKVQDRIVFEQQTMLRRMILECPHRHWIIGHDYEEGYACKAKPNGMYDDWCDECIRTEFEKENKKNES